MQPQGGSAATRLFVTQLCDGPAIPMSTVPGDSRASLLFGMLPLLDELAQMVSTHLQPLGDVIRPARLRVNGEVISMRLAETLTDETLCLSLATHDRQPGPQDDTSLMLAGHQRLIHVPTVGLYYVWIPHLDTPPQEPLSASTATPISSKCRTSSIPD